MKKIRILLYIIIAINILISIFLIFNKQNNSKNIDNNVVSTKSIELNGKIMPENHYKFEEKLNDKETAKELYGDIYYLVKNLYRLYENSSKKDLQTNYKENKESYVGLYKLSTLDDYQNLIKQCRIIYSEGNVYYDTVKILMDEYKQDNQEIICVFEVIFKNDKSLKIKFSIDKDKNILFYPINEV